MNPEFGRRVAITLGALLVFRIGTYIPLPGINSAVWDQIWPSYGGGVLGTANMLSGGTVSMDPNDIRVATTMDQVLAKEIGKGGLIALCLSGRGDKDVGTVAAALGRQI